MYVGTNLITGAHHDGHDGKALFFRGGRIWAKACTITQTLDGVTSDAPANVLWGERMVVSFTPESGKVLLPSTVRVTMGGVDITDTAFRLLTNTIDIPSVTDDVEITAQAAVVPSAYTPLQYITKATHNTAARIVTDYYSTNNTEIEFDIWQVGGSAVYIAHAGFTPQGSGSNTYDFVLRIRYASGSIGTALRWGNTSRTSASGLPGTHAQYTTPNKRCYVFMGKTYHVDNMRVADIDDGSEFVNEDTMIFLGANSNSAGGFQGNIYNLKHSESGVLAHHYIPVAVEGGYLGFYEIVNGTLTPYTSASYYLAPNVILSNSLTNCAATRLSAAATGNTSRAVIGSTWSVKLTPTASSNSTFNHEDAGISLKIGGVDVTNSDNTDGTPYVAYDSASDTYTVTIADVPQESIELTAVAVSGSSNVLNGMQNTENEDI